MKMYQFFVLTGLISSFLLFNLYDRWENLMMRSNHRAISLGGDTFSIKKYDSEIRKLEPFPITHLSQLYIAMGEVSVWYIKNKKPKTNLSEIKIWKSAVFAKTEYEKLWEILIDRNVQGKSIQDEDIKNLKYLKSRQLKFLNRNDKIVWRFIKTFIDRMDDFYFFWEKAIFALCVADGDVMAQARAAFSSYSGGMDQQCRWENAYSSHSNLDRTYFEQVKEMSLRRYDAHRLPAKVARATIQKERPQAKSMSFNKIQYDKVRDGEVFQLPTREICVFKRGKLQCLRRANDLVCLSSLGKLKNIKPKKLRKEDLSNFQVKVLNRFKTCENFNTELRPISSLIRTKKRIKLRVRPGGKLITIVPKGATLQIIDYWIESLDQKHTYYKVAFNGKSGFIYGGTESTSKRWLSLVYERKELNNELAKLVEKFKDFLQL